MKAVSIADVIKVKCPQLTLGCIEISIQVKSEYKELIVLINSSLVSLQTSINVDEIASLPTIHNTRKAYLACGKKPSRYRPSAEALLRRVAMGKGLYEVNNVVDALNLLSIETGFSIGGYDADKLQGTIKLGIGKKEPYQAIGRGDLNIEFLPVLSDELGPFGSPTSDSVRTSVTENTTRFLMIIFAFGGEEELDDAIDRAVELLSIYADGKDVTRSKIS